MWPCRDDCTALPDRLRALNTLLERRFALSILCALHAGATRFNQISWMVGDASPRTLSQRLTELEEARLVQRVVVVDVRPPRVEYRLTARGMALAPLVGELVALAISSA